MPTVTGIPINAQYVYGTSLQQAFIDRRTGQPLSAGTLTFSRDADRMTLKPIYAVSGTDDDPVFTPLDNPLALSSVGTIFDKNNNQDIVPVYKPYDDNGKPDPYYIVVKASDGFNQGTFTNFPFVNDDSSDITIQAQNIIPDGQFLFHYDLLDDGLISEDVTAIAFGGWTFVQTHNTTSTNYVTFERFNAPIDSPTANPRYSARIRCTNPDPSDDRKDLVLAIGDVNFLQNIATTYQVTLWANDGVNHNIQLILRKFYGDTFTASPPTEVVLSTFTITPEIVNYPVNFTVTSNEDEIISDNDTDQFQLILRWPLATVSDISADNAMYVIGTFATLNYPDTSPEQAAAFALPGSFATPAHDGSDLGKVPTLAIMPNNQLGFIYSNPTPTGITLLTNRISSDPDDGCVWEDGTAYDRTDPIYIDLFNTIGFSQGTGQNGFVNSSSGTNILFQRYNRNDFTQPGADAGTSGFTFSNTTIDSFTAVQITTLPASGITEGAYYRMLVNTSGPQFVQLFWFSIDGNGIIPVVDHDVAVEIKLLSSDTDQQVRDNLLQNANGLFQAPDSRGYFFRIVSGTSGRDPEAGSRGNCGYSNSGNGGNNVGSTQGSQYQSHNHHITYNGSPTHSGSPDNGSGPLGSSDIGTDTGQLPDYTDSNGGSETRPINVYKLAEITL